MRRMWAYGIELPFGTTPHEFLRQDVDWQHRSFHQQQQQQQRQWFLLQVP